MTGFLWSDDADAFFGEDSGAASKPAKGGSPARKSPREKTTVQLGATSESPLNVSQLNAMVKRAIDASIQTFWLAGEIGTLMQSSSGHVYLTIKDNANQISAVIWRSTMERVGIDLREGMAVLVQGRLDVYGPRGAYQVVISRLEEQGVGALQQAFRRLYAKLDAEGLFSAERKKELPAFPTRIGFVTSPNGAAIRDFIEVLRRRWPGASVLVVPARVQGEGAAADIAKGIRIAAMIRPKLDVLVVGRGGGSLEDLWAFNEEVVVRAIVNCPLPTVSAVGHEIDVTLSDLAADVRALTPSEAAERIVPSRDELVDSLNAVRLRLDSLITNRIAQYELRLNGIATRPILQDPSRLLETMTQQVDDLHQASDLAIDQILQLQSQKMERLAQVLDAISPLKTLARGYSVTTEATSGKLAKAASLKTGQLIKTRLEDGIVTSEVKETNPLAGRN